jgi:hypothetical protein
MTRNASPRRVRFAIGAMILMGTAACASSPASSPAPQTAPAAPAPIADKVPPSTVDRLRQLIDSHQLTEVRTTYNSTYGASLLFQSDTLTYYVALFHGKEFWRVMQTDSFEDAESLYRTFATQTQSLAEVDIDTMRLDAGKKYAERMIALNQQRLQTLQQDASHQQQEARQVAEQQEQARQQAAALTADLHSTTNQLDAVKQQIRALEAMQANPSLVLPTPAPAAPPAPPAQAPQQPPAGSP